MTVWEVRQLIDGMALNSRLTFSGEHGQAVTVHKSINGSIFIDGRAHYHLYWTGRGREVPKVKFIPPVPVNIGDEPVVPVVRRVK